MAMVNLNMEEVTNLMTSLVHHEDLRMTFTQLTSGEARIPLIDFWNKKVVKREESTWITESEIRYWKEINIHVIAQTWGNTSGGWETIGGAAMTKLYTCIIENDWYGLSFIYYSGKLAYICEIDEKYTKIKEKGYRGLPGLGGCREILTVLYTRK